MILTRAQIGKNHALLKINFMLSTRFVVMWSNLLPRHRSESIFLIIFDPSKRLLAEILLSLSITLFVESVASSNNLSHSQKGD